MLYVFERKETTIEVVTEKLNYLISEQRKRKKEVYFGKDDVYYASKEIVAINNEILCGAYPNDRLFAITVKSPRNEFENVYFGIFYILENKIRNLGSIQLLFRAKYIKRCNFPVFYSRAIGMSRLADATYSLTRFFEEIGCKFQFSYPLI